MGAIRNLSLLGEKMSAKFIPPRDVAAEKRADAIKAQLTSILSSYISGRGKGTKTEKAVDEIIGALDPYLRLGTKNEKGATVMTEAASMRSASKGPSNL
jgi:hypothetical protein